MRRHGIVQSFLTGHLPQQQQGRKTCQIFGGNKDNLIKNGAILLEERISLFDGTTNPIHCFSVDDLNSMNVDNDPIFMDGFHIYYVGVWDRKSVLVKVLHDDIRDKLFKLACREIAVATQMGTHSNVHRLLGCCLDTTHPVLVFQWADNVTLDRRIVNYNEQSEEPLEWKDRVRIGWEIAHAVSYLHTAFRQPVIHRNLKPSVVFLDQDGSARLSDFSLSISIPVGKKHVKDNIIGTLGYLAPEYGLSCKVAKSSDVFSFGVLLLVLLTGKPAIFSSEPNHDQYIVDWVNDCRAANCLGDIVDPAITRNGPVADEQFEHHLKTFVELALRCSLKEEEHRPTMVDVATQLRMIMSSFDSL